MTIEEIDREIERLERLKSEMKNKLLSNHKDYIGKYYKRGDLVIGQIYDEKIILHVKELYFENDNYQIYNDYDSCKPEEIEIISKDEFLETLNGWFSKIIKMYDTQLAQ